MKTHKCCICKEEILYEDYIGGGKGMQIVKNRDKIYRNPKSKIVCDSCYKRVVIV